MRNNRTFTMIKPDAITNGHAGSILAHIEKAGFKIIAMKLTRLNIIWKYQQKTGEDKRKA